MLMARAALRAPRALQGHEGPWTMLFFPIAFILLSIFLEKSRLSIWRSRRSLLILNYCFRSCSSELPETPFPGYPEPTASVSEAEFSVTRGVSSLSWKSENSSKVVFSGCLGCFLGSSAVILASWSLIRMVVGSF